MEQQRREFREGLGQGSEDAAGEAAPVEEGYSSLEIAAESGADDVAEDATAESEDAASPDLEAAAEEQEAEEEDEADEGKKE